MAHLNKVVRSVNAPGDQRCVDILRGPDGRFGYAEYRRDPEDDRGWYPTGLARGPEFLSQSEAENAARSAILWLEEHSDLEA